MAQVRKFRTWLSQGHLKIQSSVALDHYPTADSCLQALTLVLYFCPLVDHYLQSLISVSSTSSLWVQDSKDSLPCSSLSNHDVFAGYFVLAFNKLPVAMILCAKFWSFIHFVVFVSWAKNVGLGRAKDKHLTGHPADIPCDKHTLQKLWTPCRSLSHCLNSWCRCWQQLP